MLKVTSLKSVLKYVIVCFFLLTGMFVLSTSFLNCAQGQPSYDISGETSFSDMASESNQSCSEGRLCLDQYDSNCYDPNIYELDENNLICPKNNN